MNIEQLRKDMEAGMQGGLSAFDRLILWHECGHGEPDLADLFAEYTALIEAADELYAATLKYQAHKLETVLKLGEAQDKYREATK
jgi:hypothetical protein